MADSRPDSKSESKPDGGICGPITVRDMRLFMDEETTALTKAVDLRIRELTQLVNAYADGELTTEQAADRLMRYKEKWGQPLPGVFFAQGVSDQEITAAVEEAAGPFTPASESRAIFERLFPRKGSAPGLSR